MPQSRKRRGHNHHQPRKPQAAPRRNNARGVWALLFGVFGALIGVFASDYSYIALAVGALLGAALGYYVGKSMEKEAAGK